MSNSLSIIWDSFTIIEALTANQVATGAIYNSSNPNLPSLSIVIRSHDNTIFGGQVAQSVADAFGALINSDTFKSQYVQFIEDNPNDSLDIYIDSRPDGASRVSDFMGNHLMIIATAQVGDWYETQNGTYRQFTLEHIMAHEFAHLVTGMADGPEFNAIVNDIIAEIDGSASRSDNYSNTFENDSCFLSGTMIEMANGTQKAIEEIVVGDMIASYSDNDPVDSKLEAKQVIKLFRNEVEHMLDVHGLRVTPGHVTLCGDGQFEGKHVPIIDILLSDGALVKADGQLVRMAINKSVGSIEDEFVQMSYALTSADAQAGKLEHGEIRVGTLLFDKDGVAISILDCLKAEGYIFDPKTGLVNKLNEQPHALYFFGALPRPEDYILRRSQETLAGILVAGEWEGSASELVAGHLRNITHMEIH